MMRQSAREAIRGRRSALASCVSALACVPGLASVSCVAREPAREPTPVEVRVDVPGPFRANEDAGAIAADEEPPRADGSPVLPPTWTAPELPGLPFVTAMGHARGARDLLLTLSPPPERERQGVLGKEWFTKTVRLADLASRMYAAAFRAIDAPDADRLVALAEGAELDMALSRRLDVLGLGTMPPAWRTDPSVQATFEDVAAGPSRRWREEARALARRCVELARDSGVVTDATQRCKALRMGAPASRAVAAAAARADAGACPCAPGDPLCSASIGGWCDP